MDTCHKICTKCSGDFPETNDFFQWDSRAGRFSSRCKICKNNQHKISDAKRRKQLKREFGSEHQYRKLYEKGFIGRRRKYDTAKYKKHTDILSNLYIARIIKRNTSLTSKEVMNNLQLISANRELIKLKRHIYAKPN